MSHERPSILPEDFPPPDAFSCHRCSLSQQRTRVIWGEGNPKAPVFVVVDNPGAREDPDGRPFLCGTRETLQKAAFEAGLAGDDLYLTYVLKCRPRRSYDKPLCRNRCLGYLWGQLEQVKPIVLVVLGNIAVQSLRGDPETEVKSSGDRYKRSTTTEPLFHIIRWPSGAGPTCIPFLSRIGDWRRRF